MSNGAAIGLPTGFEFGVATAAYQIEGAVAEDGRGPSIWDTFSHRPGTVHQGETGDIACDHYHRFAEDVASMRELGVDSYRFSVAWPRIMPTGAGAVNEAGLAFYDRLVDELLAAGIAPALTLYHWDLPQPLQDTGGWMNRDTALRFVDYATTVHARLADRVHRWITLNEPFCSSILGYAVGAHAPGLATGQGALAAAHHLLLGHGMATAALRAADPSGQYGITLNLQPVKPVSESEADIAAARRALCLSNLIFTDPVLAGRYPPTGAETFGDISDFSFVVDGDLATIAAPLDFLGVNYYFPARIAATQLRETDPSKRTADDIGARMELVDGEELTEMGWPVDAGAFSDLLGWLAITYPDLPPIYITENGRACADVMTESGAVHDPERISYLDAHLRAVADSIAAGVDVRGYYCWSLMDNFEWAEGYSKRFGLLYVDYPTQRRIHKDSFGYYRNLIAAQHTAGS